MRVRSTCFVIILCLFQLIGLAEKGESSRILIHTLNYLSHDYLFDVSGGKVINADEFEEMQDFSASAVRYFREFSPAWSDSDSASIGTGIYRLDSLVNHHAAKEYVASAA